MSDQKIKLFKTVADLHNSGRVKLSEAQKATIDRETQDLVRKSLFNRSASKTPDGFDQILEDLKKI